jgi:hypothetical protein
MGFLGKKCRSTGFEPGKPKKPQKPGNFLRAECLPTIFTGKNPTENSVFGQKKSKNGLPKKRVFDPKMGVFWGGLGKKVPFFGFFGDIFGG